MGLNHACNSCGGSIEFAPEHTGLQGNCPHCGMLTVLTASAPAAVPPYGGPTPAPGPYPAPQQMPYGGMGGPVPGPMPQPARGGISTGGIIGIVVGALVAVGLIVFGIIMLTGKSGGGGSGGSGGGTPSKVVSEKEDFTKMHVDYRAKIFPLELEAAKLLARLDNVSDDDEVLTIMVEVLGNISNRTMLLKMMDPKTSGVSSLHKEYVEYCETGLIIWRQVIGALEDGDERKAREIIFNKLKSQTDLLADWVKQFNRLCEKHKLPDLDAIMKDLL